MIKEALQYIVGLGNAEVKEYTLPDGKKGMYSDKPLHRLETPVPIADKLYLHTLTGLVDYIKSNTDTMAEKMVVEVQSPTKVHLYSQLNSKRNREYLIEVDAMLPDFRFDEYLDHEHFCVGVQSKFIDSDDRKNVLKFAGTVENGTVAQYSDDGISQKATIKTGIASKAAAIVPNPVTLKPYRTFLEVDQPASDFIFRMKEYSGSIGCALFEADGGAWKIEAMQNIKMYLQKELEGLDQFTVIA